MKMGTVISFILSLAASATFAATETMLKVPSEVPQTKAVCTIAKIATPLMSHYGNLGQPVARYFKVREGEEIEIAFVRQVDRANYQLQRDLKLFKILAEGKDHFRPVYDAITNSYAKSCPITGASEEACRQAYVQRRESLQAAQELKRNYYAKFRDSGIAHGTRFEQMFNSNGDDYVGHFVEPKLADYLNEKYEPTAMGILFDGVLEYAEHRSGDVDAYPNDGHYLLEEQANGRSKYSMKRGPDASPMKDFITVRQTSDSTFDLRMTVFAHDATIESTDARVDMKCKM